MPAGGGGLSRGIAPPAYELLADRLEARIRTGVLAAGDVLASETGLALEHGVSRQTVSRALEVIARKGLVSRRQGVGTRVMPSSLTREPLTRDVEIVGLGSDAQPHEIVLVRQTAAGDDALQLQIAGSDLVVRVTRCCTGPGGKVLATFHDVIPVSELRGPKSLDPRRWSEDDETWTIDRCVLRRVTLSARRAQPADLLPSAQGEVVFVTRRLHFASTSRPIRLGQDVVLGAHAQYRSIETAQR